MLASSSVGQRFSQLIQALGMSKNAFAISLDKTATVIQHLVDERNKPGFDLMNKVVDVYPNVSIEWLLRGKGPMMLTEPKATSSHIPAPTAEAAPPAARLPMAPAAPKVAPATPGFPTPLFAVSPARPVASEAAMPLAATAATATAPAPTTPAFAALPEAAAPTTGPAVSLPAEPVVATAPSVPLLAMQPSAPVAAAVAPVPPPPTLDAATLTAALHAQHLQHQLALAEQRNQHLLEQQKLILERQALMQQMLDLMRRPV